MARKVNNFNTKGDPTTPDFDVKITSTADGDVQHVNIDNISDPTLLEFLGGEGWPAGVYVQLSKVIVDYGDHAAQGIIQVGGSDNGTARILSLDSFGKPSINNISGTVSLPTGASTEATLSALNTKITTSPHNESAELALNVSFPNFARQDFADTAETASTASVIKATAHTVKEGDWIWFYGGNLNRQARRVATKTANDFTVSSPFSQAPANGDSFYIYTDGFQRVNNIGVSFVTDSTTAGIAQSIDNAMRLDTASVYYPNNSSSTAYEASRIVKASAGVLFSLNGFNSGPAQWIQFFNSTTVPGNGTAPVLPIYVAANSPFSYQPPKGRYFSTGITVCNSSTGSTKTLGAADCWFDIQYK